MRIGKKGLLIGASGVAGLAAAAALVAGTTFGLFSATASSQTNSFTSGVLTVTTAHIGQATCTVTNMKPGDESTGYTPSTPDNTQTPKDVACTYGVIIGRTTSAYVGVSIKETGTLPLKWEIHQTTVSNTFATNGVINTNTTTDPLYVGNSTNEYTVTVNYYLPRTDTTQSKNSAALTLTFHVVQQANNGTGAKCVIGKQCASTATGIRNWS